MSFKSKNLKESLLSNYENFYNDGDSEKNESPIESNNGFYYKIRTSFEKIFSKNEKNYQSSKVNSSEDEERRTTSSNSVISETESELPKSTNNFILEAEKHKLASRVHKPKIPLYDDEYCECCGNIIENEQFEADCPIADLVSLGGCFPLYFHLIKYCIKILLIAFLVAGISTIFSNLFISVKDGISTQVSNWNTKETTLIDICIYQISGLVIATSNSPDISSETYTINIIVQTILSFIATIMMIIYFIRFKTTQKQFILELRQNLVSPSQYTVMLFGLRGISFTKTDILYYLKRFLDQKDISLVKKLVICYDIDNIIKKNEEISKIKKKYTIIQKKLVKEQKSSFVERFEKIEDLKKQIKNFEAEEAAQKNLREDEIRKMYAQDDGFQKSGVVFVSFASREILLQFVKATKSSCLFKWLIKSIYWLSWGFFFKSYLIKGKFVKIRQALEPSDIIWENFTIHPFEAFVKRIMTTFITIIVSLICFCLLCIFSYAKQANEANILIQIACSLSVVIFNQLLMDASTLLTKYEKQPSHTENEVSRALKLIGALFFNTAFTSPLVTIYMNFVHVSNSDWGQFCQNLNQVSYEITVAMTFLSVTNALVSPLLAYFDFFYLYKNIQQFILKHKKTTTHTQEEINSIFEYQNADIAIIYARVMKTVIFTAFYAPIIPICIPVAILGLVLNYYIQKYLLVKRNSSPLEFGELLAERMSGLVKTSIWIFSLNSFVLWSFSLWYQQYMGTEYYIGNEFLSNLLIIPIMTLIIGNIAFLLPSRFFKSHIIEENLFLTKYDSSFLKFETDYDLTNPATRKEGELQFLKRLSHIENNKEKKLEIQYSINELENQPDSLYLENYFGTLTQMKYKANKSFVQAKKNLWVAFSKRRFTFIQQMENYAL